MPSPPDRTSANNSPSSFPHSLHHRRLNRGRKIRYATDDELGLRFSDEACPECAAALSRSPPEPSSHHWSSSAVPKPLPLPDFSLNATQLKSSGGPNTGGTGSASCERKHVNHATNGSSRTINIISATAREFCKLKHQVCVNNGQRSSSILRNGFSSSPVSPRQTNSQHHFLPPDTVAAMPSLFNRRKGLCPDLNVESRNCNLRLNVPARSAPTSAFSSPSTSPNRRPNSADVLPSFSSRAQEFHGSAALAIHRAGRPALSTPLSPVKTVHTMDQSPEHSPSVQSPRSNVRSLDEVVFSSNHSVPTENTKDWPQVSASVSAHPLPLPPGASLSLQSSIPSQSVAAVQSIDKPVTYKSKWRKGRLIGRGTYGSVYIATNVETGATCAMKEVDIIPDDSKSAECIEQLEKEIEILSELQHPNIVQYYGSEIVDDHFYIYLEYVHPGSINKYIREHCEAMTESIVRNFTRHILSGLVYLHSKKTIHRDIKGPNLLVDAKGIVKLADFGMAKHLTGLCYELSLKGSPYWMAPEVIKAVMQKDANSDLALAVDIWSVGCTIIEMLTGKPPWSDLEGPQAMFKVLNRSPDIPETLSAEGKDFLQCCFRRNPAERPSALMLLEHPFVRCSPSRSISAGVQALPREHLTDKSQSIGTCHNHTNSHDHLVYARIASGKSSCNSNSESCHQAYAVMASQQPHPPYSNPLLRTWPPKMQMIHSPHGFAPLKISRNAHLSADLDHVCSPLRGHGGQVRHL